MHFARGLAARKYFTYGDLARFGYAQAKFQLTGRGEQRRRRGRAHQGARVHRGPADLRADRGRRGDLRRDHRRQDLAGHPRTGRHAPGRRAAGVARHRDAVRAGRHHRPKAGADRRARHGRRIGGRRVHRPAGRRDPARRGQGARRPVAGHPRGAQPEALHRLLGQHQRRPDAVAGRHRRRDQPRRRAARHGPQAGLGDPRLPHGPQGSPHRGSIGAGARRSAAAPWPQSCPVAGMAAEGIADRLGAAGPRDTERGAPTEP